MLASALAGFFLTTELVNVPFLIVCIFAVLLGRFLGDRRRSRGHAPSNRLRSHLPGFHAQVPFRRSDGNIPQDGSIYGDPGFWSSRGSYHSWGTRRRRFAT
jgi:hypothetical protein